jgi:cellulose/xylan binding protein with CBM9 domain
MAKPVLMIGLTAVAGLLAGSTAPIRPANKSGPEISRYTVKRALGTIRVDGVLDESSWKAAAGTGPFMLNDGTGLPATKTEAKMLWDDQNLYFGFQCEDTDLFATMKVRDQHLWEEEVVEIFIDPDNDQLNYIELEINPLKTLLDLFVLKPIVPIPYESYNIPAKWAVKVNGTVNNSTDKDKGWTVELSLPLKEAVTAPHLPPNEDDKWRLNLYRIEKKPKEEYSAWSPTLVSSYHTPARFGEITFSNRKAGE